MKKLISLLVLHFIAIQTFAQVPQKMSYQSVIRNSAGNLVANANIGTRISILENSATGTAVYAETVTAQTNENGLLSLEIGTGTPLIGTFTAINWAAGNYFIKTETDIAGGNNYTVSSTEQLMSVPYALFAGSTKNQGKTTIFLTGDITNAQAVALIDQEVGPNTENIIIDDTSVLTTVDLSRIKKILNLQITDNLSLTTVNLSQLELVFIDFNVKTNPLLNNFQLPNFNYISKKMIIENNNSLTSLNFPSLIKMRSNSEFNVIANTALQTIGFPVLTQMGTSSTLKIIGNSSLTAMTAPQLVNGSTIEISDSINFNMFNFNALQNINLLTAISNNLTSANLNNLLTGFVYLNSPVLSTVNLPIMTSGLVNISSNAITTFSLPQFTNGDINVSGLGLTTVNFPLLASSKNLSFVSCSFSTLNFPSLVSIGYILIGNSPNLTTVNFPVLTNLNLANISSNAVLTAINIPAFNAFNSLSFGGKEFQFMNNKLSSAAINYILNKAVTATPTTGKNIQISNQNPPAPPTGQGITDKNTLISQGNLVTTD